MIPQRIFEYSVVVIKEYSTTKIHYLFELNHVAMSLHTSEIVVIALVH